MIAALAAASIGAVWSSCSPDFGVQGVIDRFGQIEPRILIAVDGYYYAGRRHSLLERTAEIARLLPSVEHTIVYGFFDSAPSVQDIPHGIAWSDFIAAGDDAEPAFEPLPFDHPLYIMYSSGTTGVLPSASCTAPAARSSSI